VIEALNINFDESYPDALRKQVLQANHCHLQFLTRFIPGHNSCVAGVACGGSEEGCNTGVWSDGRLDE
jgi:hypothetical protein